MPIAPITQIRKLRPSEAKNLDHIHMACQRQNWSWNSYLPPAFSLLQVGEGQWLDGWTGEVIVLAREQKFSNETDAFYLKMSTASHAIETESTGLVLEQIGVRHQKGLPVEEPQERKY